MQIDLVFSCCDMIHIILYFEVCVFLFRRLPNRLIQALHRHIPRAFPVVRASAAAVPGMALLTMVLLLILLLLLVVMLVVLLYGQGKLPLYAWLSNLGYYCFRFAIWRRLSSCFALLPCCAVHRSCPPLLGNASVDCCLFDPRRASAWEWFAGTRK